MDKKHESTISFSRKAFKDWKQADLDDALKDTEELKSSILESNETIEFLCSKFNANSLNRLKYILFS